VFYVYLIHGICPENTILCGGAFRSTAGRVLLANVSSGMHYLTEGTFTCLKANNFVFML
jgi:hypothetical protein